MNILSILIPFVIMGVVLWFLKQMRQPNKPKTPKDTHSTRQERAVWAWARVVDALNDPVDATGTARVQLQLEVHMPGTPAYLAKTTWLVQADSLAFVEKGKEISLKVDPQGPQFIYPNGSWAKILG